MAMEITQALLAAQSPDGQTRTAAEANLKQFQEQNLPQFLLSLSFELSNDQKPPESRRLAGIILKNSLDAKDSVRKDQLTQQWVSVDPSTKFQIKESLLRTLGSSVAEARHTTSQVIAKVASIEIPRKEWQDLIAKLLGNVTQQFAPGFLKQSTLETLGYVCEEVAPQDLEQDQVNAVLTAVVQGMTSAEPKSDVRLAAVRALYNALDFAQTNFENQVERNFIMKVVCETAVSKESAEIRQAAFECLVAIASIYYDYLEPYMQTLFNLTAEAVRGDEEPVALQAIEFWSTLAEEEMERQDDCVELDELNSPLLHFHFIDKALESLVPMLLETLLKQEEDQDQDDTVWNLSMAGGTCLGLVSKTVGDKVVPLVMPFVERNITKADWNSREAATFAFGSILEGPSVEKLSPLARSGFEFLLSAMKDQSSHVRDTTAWTLGRLFELVHRPASSDPVINEKNLPGIMAVLLESIRDVPNVAEKVCGALYFLAQGYEDAGPASKALTPYYESIIAALLSTADRADVSNVRLRASAYETLNEVVRCNYVPETLNTTAQLLQEIIRRVTQTLELQVISSDDREKQSDLQALLCGVLQVIIQKIGGSEGKSVILQVADQMMMVFLRVLSCRSSTVHEEAMLAIGALAYVTGADFAKYMQELYRFLEMGLTNFEEYQVCSISVGVVGDICRALDDKILPYCDAIMTVLLKDLSDAMLNRSVKPPIFSCFGDIALAIGEKFDKYLPYAAPMMQSASEMCMHLDSNDDDMVEYVNQLRRGIFEAYSGMLQGFKNSKPEIMVPYAVSLMQFIEGVSQDHSSDDLVTKAAVAALGDIADALGGSIKGLLAESSFYNDLLSECFQSDDDTLKETAGWAHGMIQHALQS